MSYAGTIDYDSMTRIITDEDRWDALSRRDPETDGSFYYAVVTTGVYCRPSCASRFPRRENVRFFPSCEEAERAGFRPCKRCRPGDTRPEDKRTSLVTKACRIIEKSKGTPDLDTLAKKLGMSRFHFHRVFKSVTGLTPKAYAGAVRRRQLREELLSRDSVTGAIYGAGFKSSGRFYASTNDALGMTPTTFRRGGRGEFIRFGVGECSLGAILVAFTDKGVCSIMLGDKPDALVRELRERFNQAELSAGGREFEGLVARVVGYVESPEPGLNLPLDIRGTAFEMSVWQALREIPPGATVSYTDIAEKIGSPKAARAVASACASNRIAVAVPCHRVVRKDGSISGYRWGADRKRKLLERESKRSESDGK